MADTVTDSVTQFDLDITVVSNNDVYGALMSNTDDGCGSTCPACASGAGGGKGGSGGSGGSGGKGGKGGKGRFIAA
ncbi:FxLD family lanthipeptide [Kitasatospora sp. NPDC028055]|uniref:FxLD family lanthipeptide n=1 Tax=Kitasatospora sp. NPDC028055 TaxID=3155653 RepID=UPI0033D5C255